VEWFSAGNLHQPSPQTASFRSQARMSAKSRDAALASGALAFLLNDYIEFFFTLPSPDLLDLREEDPEAAAITLRQHWGLGERPIKNMIHLLESKGIRVFSMAEDTVEVDAFSLWRETTPFIFLNTLKSSERSRFDAAHELGHLVLHRHDEPKGKQAEHEANRFASAFLMPRGSILSHTPAMPSLNTLIKLKKYWIVAVSALAYRLNQLELLTDWHYRHLCIEIGNRGFRTSEPEEAPREMSLIFPKIFKMLRDEGITKATIADKLFVNVEDIDKLVFGLILVVLKNKSVKKTNQVKKTNLRIVD
jgi:Zn-dependent peptidase ImmA (M78 family)